MTTDPTLLPAAEAAHGVGFGLSGFTVTDVLTAEELEQLLAAVRDAIAAPVLALHPRTNSGHCGTCCHCPCDRRPEVLHPCPTLQALGVTG